MVSPQSRVATQPLTIYETLVAEQRMRDRANTPISSRITLNGNERFAIGLDHGNAALKVALLAQDGRLLTLRIPTAYAAAREIRGGVGAVSYRVDGSTAFWLGDVALQLTPKVDALTQGNTAERLQDLRLRQCIAAALVEGIHKAGYPAGEYQLALGFAVPPEEITREKGDRLGVNADTKGALKQTLKDKMFSIVRTNEHDEEQLYTLHINDIVPQGQGIGTMLAMTKTPWGSTITDIDSMYVLDIGGGDLYSTYVTMNPYRMMTDRLGSGTIDLAVELRRMLRDEHPKLEMSDALAQQCLVTRQISLGGRKHSIDGLVQEVVQTLGQDIVGRMKDQLTETQAYITITGGGAILLRDLLIERAATLGRDETNFCLIDPHLSATLTAVGTLFAVIFLTAKV